MMFTPQEYKKKQCLTCKWWRESRYLNEIQKKDPDALTRGYCIRFPHNEIKTFNEFCGEFLPK